MREPVSSLPRTQEERNLDPGLRLVECGVVLDRTAEDPRPPCSAAAASERRDELVDELRPVHLDGKRLHRIDYGQRAIGDHEPIG